MTFEEIDERYHEAALDDDTGDGWDDPSEITDDDDDDLDESAEDDDE
jgi:hypothetical protein